MASNDEKFLGIIDKFIDSVTVVNQNLGPIKDLLGYVREMLTEINSTIERINEDNGVLRAELAELKNLSSSGKENLIKLLTISETLLERGIDVKDFELKKMELENALKIAELNQTHTSVRETATRRWTFWGIAVPAFFSLVGLIAGFMLKKEPLDDKKGKVEKKVEQSKEN